MIRIESTSTPQEIIKEEETDPKKLLTLFSETFPLREPYFNGQNQFSRYDAPVLNKLCRNYKWLSRALDHVATLPKKSYLKLQAIAKHLGKLPPSQRTSIFRLLQPQLGSFNPLNIKKAWDETKSYIKGQKWLVDASNRKIVNALTREVNEVIPDIGYISPCIQEITLQFAGKEKLLTPLINEEIHQNKDLYRYVEKTLLKKAKNWLFQEGNLKNLEIRGYLTMDETGKKIEHITDESSKLLLEEIEKVQKFKNPC